MRVLIVDDQVGIRRVILNALNQLGYECHEAANGREALTMLAALEVDLVITDLAMPVMDGMEFIARLRTNVAMRELPIIMITGAGDRHSVLEAARVGVVGFIVKPFSIATVQEKIQAFAQKAAGEPEPEAEPASDAGMSSSVAVCEREA